MDATRDYTDPTETARAMMRDITKMLEDGARSLDGRTMTVDAITHGGFPSLHDYCDANTLGGLCGAVSDHYHGPVPDDAPDDVYNAANDAWIDHGNAATDIVDLWLRAGMPELDGHAISIASLCGRCDEVFCPSDVADQIHLEREDGTPCGGLARTLNVYRKA